MIDPKDINVYRYLVEELRKDRTMHKIVVVYPEEIINLVADHNKVLEENKRLKSLELRLSDVLAENIRLSDEIKLLKKS